MPTEAALGTAAQGHPYTQQHDTPGKVAEAEKRKDF